MSELDREIEAVMKPLTDKERSFAHEYALVPNPSHAAKEAGYSPKTAASQASQMLKKAKIRKAVNLIRQKNELEAGIDQVDILRQLKDIALRCQQQEPVLDKHGEPIGEYRFDAKNALAALDIICKMGGHYAPKKLDVDTAVNFIQVFGETED